MTHLSQNHAAATNPCPSEGDVATASESLSAALRALDEACMHVESAAEHFADVTYTERTHCLLKAYLITCALRRFYDISKH